MQVFSAFDSRYFSLKWFMLLRSVLSKINMFKKVRKRKNNYYIHFSVEKLEQKVLGYLSKNANAQKQAEP